MDEPPMNIMNKMIPRVTRYIRDISLDRMPVIGATSFTVKPLAQGEYNLNFLITAGDLKFVFRVNMGSQIDRKDQILYEYKALELLEKSGVTPRPYFVDDSRTALDRGVLIMEYLPGESLDYHRDLCGAARLFSKVHQVQVPEERNHLIREEAPLTLIWTECARLLQTYFDSEFSDPEIRSYLLELLQWADETRRTERFYQEDPWPCIVNTEVNSANFIVNRTAGTIHLVDWEMPRWGDPSQDLSHFCSPLTTLWKSSYRMATGVKRDFLDTYAATIPDSHLRDTLYERVRLRDPFVYLRGISWSAMAWVAYRTRFSGVKNLDTWDTLNRYMRLGFIRELFDPFLKN